MPFLHLTHRLEYRWLGPPPDVAPTLVFLHHGLGSVSAWRDLPDRVADLTGLGVLVYSRHGHGNSEAIAPAARPVDFMHVEAREVLPEVLEALEVQSPILVGQSDGASIALIYAASDLSPKPLGLALLAPHVFVEQCTVDSAAAARVAFEAGRLKTGLARHHADPEGVFRSWNATWLLPEFRAWNIEAILANVRCPVTLVQGLDDEYGTVEQVERIRRVVAGSEAVLLHDCGHSPQRDQPVSTLDAVRKLVDRALRDGNTPP